MVLFMDRNETAPEIPRGVPESLWKLHKSKDLTFLHGSYTQLFFSTPKKNFFFGDRKNIFLEIFQKSGKSRKFQGKSILILLEVHKKYHDL